MNHHGQTNINLADRNRRVIHIYNGKSVTKVLNYDRSRFIQWPYCLWLPPLGQKLEPPCGGGSTEYPQPMFWSKNKKNRYTSVYPIFTIKSGVQGGGGAYITWTCYSDGLKV